MIDRRSEPQNGLTPTQLTPRRNDSLITRIAKRIFPQLPWYGPQADERETTQTGLVSNLVSAIYDRYFKYETVRERIYSDVEEMDQASEEGSLALDTIASNICVSEEGKQLNFIVRAKGLEVGMSQITPNKLIKQSGLQNEVEEGDIEDPSEQMEKKVSQQQAQKVQDVLDRTTRICKLHMQVRPLARNALKYGDSFGEIVVSAKGELVGFKQLPPASMQRHEDLKGNLVLSRPRYDSSGKCINKEGECAFQQVDENSTHRVLASFWPWQIVHTRLNWDGFSPYGQSMLRVARLTFRKLKAIEESMIIGRMTRDLLKLVFYVDTTGLSPDQSQVVLSTFEQQVVNSQKVGGSREQPYNVMSDFFMNDGYVVVGGQAMPRRSRIESIDPKNEGLHQLADVEYQQRKLLALLWVPNADMGFEKDIGGKNLLTQQGVQYVRRLREVQGIISDSLSQIYDTALILAGIDPEEAEYEITWPSLATMDDKAMAEAEYARAQTDAIYLGNSQQNGTPVIDPRWILKHRMDMTDEMISDLMNRMEQNQRLQEQKDQEKAQSMFENQIKLAQANKTGNAGPGHDNGNTAFMKKDDGGDTKRKRPVAAEVSMLSSLIMDRTSQLLADDLLAVNRDQLVTLEMARDLAGIDAEKKVAAREIRAETVTADVAPAPVIQVHNHFEKGMVEHSSHHEISIPEREVKIEHHTHVDTPKAPDVKAEIHVPPAPPAQIEHHTHVETPVEVHVPQQAPPNVEVKVERVKPHGVEVRRDNEGNITSIEPKDEEDDWFK